MTIATMEDLEALPMGERIEVRSHAGGRKMWTRVENGLQHEDMPVLGLDLFVGALAEGVVVRTAPLVPSVGDMYAATSYLDHRYKYLVVEVDKETKRVTCLYFRYQVYRETRTRAFEAMREHRFIPEDERPDWWRMALALGVGWRNSETVLSIVRTELRRLAGLH